MMEGTALYQGEQADGSHDILVRLTVIHANPDLDYNVGITLRVDPDVFEGLDSNNMVPIVRVRRGH